MVAAPGAGTVSLAELVDQVAERGRGLVLTMGKGGVGKTTLAAGIAVELARRGHPVELTTTDPAAHVAAVMGADAGGLSTLRVSRIDPEQVTAAYTAEVLAEAGAGMDAPARAVLEEDLRSPCTVEIAVFRAFARTVASATDRFVVLDTAPTGHTLLLLDATRAYHREVGRQGGAAPPEVETLLDRLTDPAFTSVFIVTLPEATPVHEAASLQEDLRRACIEPTAWIVNQSLAATAVSDPVLVARASAEVRYIDEVATRHASRVAIVPLLAEALTGAAGVALLLGARAVAQT
jgi:arsenite-transporting ATPase